MATYSRKPVTIDVHPSLMETAGKLGMFLQNLEQLYCSCCTSLEVSANSLELNTLTASNGKIKLTGLELPLNVVKVYAEKSTDFEQEILKKEQTGEKSREKLFEHIAKGIDKIDKKDLSDHVMQATRYYLYQQHGL